VIAAKEDDEDEEKAGLEAIYTHCSLAYAHCSLAYAHCSLAYAHCSLADENLILAPLHLSHKIYKKVNQGGV
jgi:hypothetical protein